MAPIIIIVMSTNNNTNRNSTTIDILFVREDRYNEELEKEKNKHLHDKYNRHDQNPPAGGKYYLLPMAFPEGSPTHPSYPAGHATVAGACVTVLKAWFNEDYPIQNPLIPSMSQLAFLAGRDIIF